MVKILSMDVPTYQFGEDREWINWSSRDRSMTTIIVFFYRASIKLRPSILIRVIQPFSLRPPGINQLDFIHACWMFRGTTPESRSKQGDQDQSQGSVTNRQQPRLLGTANALIDDQEKTLRSMEKRGDDQAALRIHV